MASDQYLCRSWRCLSPRPAWCWALVITESRACTVQCTGDLEKVKQYKPTDCTTNPSLVLKAVQDPQYAHYLEDAIKEEKEANDSFKVEGRPFAGVQRWRSPALLPGHLLLCCSSWRRMPAAWCACASGQPAQCSFAPALAHCVPARGAQWCGMLCIDTACLIILSFPCSRCAAVRMYRG